MNTVKTVERTIMITFRVTEAELKQLNDAAKVKKLTRSDYIRKSLKLDAETVSE